MFGAFLLIVYGAIIGLLVAPIPGSIPQLDQQLRPAFAILRRPRHLHDRLGASSSFIPA
jgi:hypothetical protein